MKIKLNYNETMEFLNTRNCWTSRNNSDYVIETGLTSTGEFIQITRASNRANTINPYDNITLNPKALKEFKELNPEQTQEILNIIENTNL